MKECYVPQNEQVNLSGAVSLAAEKVKLGIESHMSQSGQGVAPEVFSELVQTAIVSQGLLGRADVSGLLLDELVEQGLDIGVSRGGEVLFGWDEPLKDPS